MTDSTRTYLNMTEKESIDSLFSNIILTSMRSSPKKTILETLFDHCITVGPNSKLTVKCDDTWTGPYLSFDSIKWNDIVYLDIKVESFLTGQAQKVLNQVIFNHKKHLALHLYINNTDNESHEEIIQKMSKFFLNLNMRKIFFISLLMIGCGNEIYYLDSYNYSDLGEPLYETKQLNSSTLNDASVEAYGIIADEIMEDEASRIKNLREILIKKIKSKIVNVIINGDLEKRIPGNLNLSFPKLNGQSILNSMPKIAVSSGSACTSSSPKPSHVLTEIGLSKKLTNSVKKLKL